MYNNSQKLDLISNLMELDSSARILLIQNSDIPEPFKSLILKMLCKEESDKKQILEKAQHGLDYIDDSYFEQLEQNLKKYNIQNKQKSEESATTENLITEADVSYKLKEKITSSSEKNIESEQKTENPESNPFSLLKDQIVNERPQAISIYNRLDKQQKSSFFEISNGFQKFQQNELRDAIEKNNVDAVKNILNNGFNVNCIDKGKSTPLHYAVEMNYLAIIKLLCEAGANIDAKDNFGWTPLYLAILKKNSGITKYLVEEAKANVNCKNNKGETPLDFANLLVEEAKANVNGQNDNGQTSLGSANLRELHKIINIISPKTFNSPKTSEDTTAVYSAIDSTRMITNTAWVVSLVRKLQGYANNPEHVFLVLEGLSPNGKAFIHRYDFVTPKQDNKAVVETNEFDQLLPTELDDKIKEILRLRSGDDNEKQYCFKAWSIASQVGEKLYQDVLADKKETHEYNSFGKTSFFAASTSQKAHNCFTWACEKLEKLDQKHIVIKTSVINPKPSQYLISDHEKQKSFCLVM